MDKEEQTELLNALRRGQQAFLAALDGITEDLAAERPGPEGWSVLECIEHVAVSEEFLLSRIMEAQYADASIINKRKEAGILAHGANRTRPVVSPEAVRPTGRFANVSDAVGHFVASRAETIRYVENCSEDLRSMLTTHPLLGPVSCQETLLLILVHPDRHAKQIGEMRAALE